MKHGRRHRTLKEKVYTDRFHQRAAGYARAYDAIDVRESAPSTPPPPPPDDTPVATRVKGKVKHALRRLGIDPDSDAREDDPETAK